MKLAKSKLKQIIREEIRHILNEGYGSLSLEEINSLGGPSIPSNPKSTPKLSANIASRLLDDALSNYVVGYTSGYTADHLGVDTSIYDAKGGMSRIDPKLARQYQAALKEAHIGRGERGQRRAMDRLVDKHWKKLLQINITTEGVELTFGDVLDVLKYHGVLNANPELRHRALWGDADPTAGGEPDPQGQAQAFKEIAERMAEGEGEEETEAYKDSLRYRLNQILNKPPAKLGGVRRKSQDLKRAREAELEKHRAYRQGE